MAAKSSSICLRYLSWFKEIEKAIINSELGITPENNGEVIRISIPPLTEERRKEKAHVA